MTPDHDSMLNYGPGSWFNVALWPKIRIPCWIVTWVMISYWIQTRSKFHVEFWPRSRLNVELWPRIKVPLLIVIQVKNLPESYFNVELQPGSYFNGNSEPSTYPLPVELWLVKVSKFISVFNIQQLHPLNINVDPKELHVPWVDRARNPVGDDKIKTFVTWWY